MNWSNLKNKAKDLLPKNNDENEDSKVRQWFVSLFIRAIEAISTEQDRLEVLSWLALVREILNRTDISKSEKAKEIYAISDTKTTVAIILRSLSAAIKNYKNSDLPLAVKIALPATLAAATVIGGQGAGIVAFGSGIGLPVLLLVFLGTAGISAILESFISSKDAKSYIGVVMALIVRDELYRQANKQFQETMTHDPAEPKHFVMPKEEQALRQTLLAMDAFEFEKHVMSFFQHQGLLSWVTKRSNDAGVDGFAKHEKGLIVVQCKRYSESNVVGRPVVQQFKGVVEENNAWRGYVVTTSRFSQEAKDSADLNERVILVDMDVLVQWHDDNRITGL
ncbi:MAG: restriction endonuclease [Acinetobacter sp.]